MSELKTKKTDASVDQYLKGIADKTKRADALSILSIMKKVTKAEPKMWGAGIVGFGHRRLKYESGRELDWFVVGFSPRKQALTLYLGLGGNVQSAGLMEQLGKHKRGKGCLYINKLEDVDLPTLTRLIAASAAANG